MTESFVVLTSARSGSTWLMDTLNRHNRLKALGEQFNPDLPENVVEGIPPYVQSEEYLRMMRPFSAFRYIRCHFPGDRPRGFKLLYRQTRRFPETMAYLTLWRDRIIHLVRRNQLNVLISLAIVYTHLKRWRLLKSDKPPDRDMQIELDPDTIVAELDRKYQIIDMARRYLHWTRMPHIDVFYKDLLEGPSAFNPIWDFMEVARPEDLGVTTLKKVQTRSHRAVIANYDDICRALENSPYFDLLEK